MHHIIIITCILISLYYQVLEWIHSHLAASEKKDKLRKLIDEGNFKIKYQVYNWDVNSW